MSSLYVSEVEGRDWGIVYEDTIDAATDVIDAARDVIMDRRAQGLGVGTYEIVRDGVVVARVLRGERVARMVRRRVQP